MAVLPGFRCVPGQHSPTRCKNAKTPDKEAALTAGFTTLAARNGPSGLPSITSLWREALLVANFKRCSPK